MGIAYQNGPLVFNTDTEGSCLRSLKQLPSTPRIHKSKKKQALEYNHYVFHNWSINKLFETQNAQLVFYTFTYKKK